MGLRFLLVWLALAASLLAADFSTVEVPPVKTSIYLGYVELVPSTLRREGNRFVGTYQAKVRPFFFGSERGTFYIDCTDEQLATLQRGERIAFTGGGTNEAGEPRRVEGHVTADEAGSLAGKIKVRIFVTKRIQLIFNTTYRFTDPAP